MTLEFSLLAAIFLPLLCALILPVLGRPMGRRVGWVAFLLPVISTGSLLFALSQLEPGGTLEVGWAWVPSIGVELSFLVDGLSLYFGLVVSGMGILIFFYANFYLDDHYRHHGRFYSYLALFMAAMLGTVLSNHLLGLFVFWELTGLASFLLIGFLHEEKPSRIGARQALLVTGLTGLVLLVGILLVGQAAGTYRLSELIASGLPWSSEGRLLTVAMVLVMVGAFGKSAQVPFHFWLPNAMAAPTPVSAYLHSATMVKLGVFLAARVFPLFADQAAWTDMLVPFGFTTMAAGALFALLSNDLKAILAWSTVSALGSFIGYYGLGDGSGVEHDYLHISNHVFYKGCLFMVAGIVIHATGSKDIRQLGGLWRRAPLLGVTCLVAAGSMAGLPGTLGFISKEALLETVLGAYHSGSALGGYALAATVVAALLKVAFSVRFFVRIFCGTEPKNVTDHYHKPPFPILLPPLLLAGGALVFGVYPAGLEPAFKHLAATGLNEHPAHLAIWHGLNPAFWLSAGIIAAGLGLYGLGQKTAWGWTRIPGWMKADRVFEQGLRGLYRVSGRMMRWLRFDQPLDYLPIILGFTALTLGGYFIWQYGVEQVDNRWLAAITWEDRPRLSLFVVALMTVSVFGVVVLKRWTTQLISLSVVGFLTTFYFVLYQAPDLALTQILVDTATLILILVLLGRFPRRAEESDLETPHASTRNRVASLVAVLMGATVCFYIILMTADPAADRIGQRFLDTTVELAEGSNAVNTILVDYRGFDTLGEITVLFIAMLACLGLVMRRKRSAKDFKLGPLARPGWNLDKE